MSSHEGLDVRRGPCVNTRQYRTDYSATGASEGTTAESVHRTMLLTADHIARLTRTPLRTVQRRLAAWRQRGGPVVRAQRDGRGQPPWAVPLDAYCRSRGMDPADVIEALSPSAQAA
jgi:hypothetical protein